MPVPSAHTHTSSRVLMRVRTSVEDREVQGRGGGRGWGRGGGGVVGGGT